MIAVASQQGKPSALRAGESVRVFVFTMQVFAHTSFYITSIMRPSNVGPK
jgi:hypothetical protein